MRPLSGRRTVSPERVAPLGAARFDFQEGADMAELDAKKRDKIRKRDFAYVDQAGDGHLPIHDESHVRNAMARWNQTDFESAEAQGQGTREDRRRSEEARYRGRPGLQRSEKRAPQGLTACQERPPDSVLSSGAAPVGARRCPRPGATPRSGVAQW